MCWKFNITLQNNILELKLVSKQRQRWHYYWDNIIILSKKEKAIWMVDFTRVSIFGRFTWDVLQQNLWKIFFTKLSYPSQTCLFHKIESSKFRLRNLPNSSNSGKLTEWSDVMGQSGNQLDWLLYGKKFCSITLRPDSRSFLELLQLRLHLQTFGSLLWFQFTYIISKLSLRVKNLYFWNFMLYLAVLTNLQ